ncbi:hypothetical protein Gpo141_00005156 [Globisporangium polare]
MFGSGARNISFQDLFTRKHDAAGSSVATADTATHRERRASPRHATSVPALVPAAPAAQSERVARMTSRDVPAISRQQLPSRRTQKGSIDFLLTGLSQGRVDTKLPPPQRPVAPVVKREPAWGFEGGPSAYTAYTPTQHHRQQQYQHINSRQLPRHESDDSSDSYEGLPAPREVVRLPSIVPGIFTNQQHELQQQQQQPASPVPESPAEEETAGGKRKKKRKARICKEEGCDKYVVDHGLCIRHGGGKRCNVEDCNCRAQNRGLCWKHGGYTICKIEGCTKRAKSRGICWSHGGGTRCKSEGCSKIAVSLGRCWAHGGGKRCSVDGCKKPASERTNNYCADHFGWFQQEGVQDV